MGIFSRRSRPLPQGAAGPSFSGLSAAEASWVSDRLGAVEAAGVDLANAADIAGLYDAVLAAWLAEPEGARPDPNPSITTIGIAFGEHLARRTSLDWVISTDRHGTELALHDPATDLLLHPANIVAKRWVEHVDGSFITTITDDVVGRLS